MKSRMPVSAGALLAGATALVFSAAVATRAHADTDDAAATGSTNALASAQAGDRVGDHFVAFAGSEANADALVNGLRAGTAISLTATANGQTTTTTFSPTTGAMGYGNVFLSLALAEAQLTKLGITQPTPAEIEAALIGGSVTTGTGSTAVTTTLTGVLVLRNQGQGFGQIAQNLGVDLHAAIASARAAADAGETAEGGQPEEARSPAGARVADRVADHFVGFAGSEANATALVNGLINGTAIDLSSTANGQTTTTTITPPTGPMSARSAFTALALAEAELGKLGDTQPTAADIQAALTGGSVTTGSGSSAVTTTLQGVLVLSHQGQSYAQIAETLGVNLQTAVATARAATDTGEMAEAGQPEEAPKHPVSPRVADRIADHFATFAGGETNSTALVTGLRDGTAVALTSTVNGQTVTTTFTPPTGKMGYGNVFLSLALAEDKLSALGITQPTPAEIEAALNGGSVTTGTGSAAVTTQLPGVLALRNQGQGFGQIAQSLGVSLRTAIANARMGADANEAAEAGQAGEAESAETASSKAVAMTMPHVDTDADESHAAAPVHVDVATTTHPDVTAVAAHPDVSAAAHAMSGFHAPPTMVVRPPEIPERPEMPVHPEIPPRPEIPHIPEMPRHGG